MKKIITTALLSLTLVSSSQLLATAEAEQNSNRLALLSRKPICIVSDPTGTPLNVRATPNGRIIGSLTNGTRVQVFISDGQSKWTRIVAERGNGYVLSAYLSNCTY